MNRKKILGIKIIAVILLSAVFLSCSKYEDLNSSSENENLENSIYLDVRNFIHTWDSNSLNKIGLFLKNSNNKTIITRSVSTDNNKIQDLEKIKEWVESGDFYEDILYNPQRGYECLKKISSAKFIEYYDMIYTVETDIDEFINKIIKEKELNSQEKIFLMLYIASYEKDLNGISTRSFISCAKRYAKLTEIVAAALIDSFAGGGPEEVVKNAEEKLSKMGPEYDC